MQRTMPIDTVSLGRRIARFRDLRGYSLGVLAERAGGLAKSYVAKLERGEVENPGLRTLSVIAKALEITVADLLAPNAPPPSARRAALLEAEAQLRSGVADLPQGLAEFLDELRSRGIEVPPSTIRALAMIEFRGRKPTRAQDWRFLFEALERSVKR